MSFHKKDRFGALKDPKVAVANFHQAQAAGLIPQNQTRQQLDAHYRKRLKKKKQAKLSRRKNRR